MKYTTASLQPGGYYHIYNRGNNREDLFKEDRNYSYFLNLYSQYVVPIADTYAYCLLKNHFHLLVRIKTEEEWKQEASRRVHGTRSILYAPSKSFANLFNAYAKAINKTYHRTGSLFEERFSRIPITEDTYFTVLIYYIHSNPQRHGLVNDFRTWRWSSYSAIMGSGNTHVKRLEVLGFFGGLEGFLRYHQEALDENLLAQHFKLEDEVE